MYQKTAPETIQTLFSSIAPHYDRANSVLSFGFHKLWNQSLATSLSPATNLLDLCAGTGEIAFSFLKTNPLAKATLLDFCPQMLSVAKEKGALFEKRFSLVTGDAQNVLLPDQSFDAVSVAYGIRNVASPGRCFKEVYRLLLPGGSFGILELTRPNSKWLRLGHALYLKTLLPLLGKWVAKDKKAYQYLSQSIQSFISPTDLKRQLQETGFSSVKIQPLMGGVATLILAKKKLG